MIVPTVCRGFSEEYGSWKIIWISDRTGASCLREACVMSWPRVRDLAAGRLQQPRDQPARRRLAAAGLADQADALADADGQVDAVDGLHGADLAFDREAAVDREVLGQPLYLEEGLGRGAGGALLCGEGEVVAHVSVLPSAAGAGSCR